MTKGRINYAEHIAQWSETDLTMAAYCRQAGLNYQTFMYHAIRKKKKEGIPAEPRQNFVQLHVPASSIEGIEYHLPGGGYFVFPAGCSVQLIKSLIG